MCDVCVWDVCVCVLCACACMCTHVCMCDRRFRQTTFSPRSMNTTSPWSYFTRNKRRYGLWPGLFSKRFTRFFPIAQHMYSCLDILRSLKSMLFLESDESKFHKAPSRLQCSVGIGGPWQKPPPINIFALKLDRYNVRSWVLRLDGN